MVGSDYAGLGTPGLMSYLNSRTTARGVVATGTPGFFAAPVTSIPGAAEAIHDFLGIPASGYDRPLFLGVGLKDRDVPPSLTLRFADQLVANGQDVTLKVYPYADHSGTVLASIPDSTAFLARVLA